MPEKTTEKGFGLYQNNALNEFEAIRKVLRVPFPEDMRDLPPSPTPFPEERRWKGPCLGFQAIIIGLAPTTPGEKSKTGKEA